MTAVEDEEVQNRTAEQHIDVQQGVAAPVPLDKEELVQDHKEEQNMDILIIGKRGSSADPTRGDRVSWQSRRPSRSAFPSASWRKLVTKQCRRSRWKRFRGS